jgi:hypothetical protein
MSCKEMIKAMSRKKLWTSPGGKTPEATLYSSILRDPEKGKDARFKNAAPGKFMLAKYSARHVPLRRPRGGTTRPLLTAGASVGQRAKR